MKLLNVHLGNVLREWLRRTEPEPLVVIDPHLVIITFCPLFDENRNSFDKSWPVGSTPCHHGESLVLHVPSRSVFWGILWKTNGVDPGLTPCPVPGLWGTSQLGTNPFLALQKKKNLVVFENDHPWWDGWHSSTVEPLTTVDISFAITVNIEILCWKECNILKRKSVFFLFNSNYTIRMASSLE